MHVDFHGACGFAIFSWSARVTTTARTRLTQIEPIHAPACSIGSVRANIWTARSTAGSTRRPAIDVDVIGCRSCQSCPLPPHSSGRKGYLLTRLPCFVYSLAAVRCRLEFVTASGRAMAALSSNELCKLSQYLLSTPRQPVNPPDPARPALSRPPGCGVSCDRYRDL